jgi:peptide/nickel transport system substrate-binding protein
MIQSDRLYERLNQIAGVKSAQTHTEKVGNTTDNSSKDNGDWLVWHLTGEPRTLNPISVDSDMSSRYIYSRHIHETLFYYDYDYDGVKLIPVLAESMDVSDGGLEITVKLKEKIWFSDGVPVTSDDVIFTYKTIMDPGIDAEDIRGYYSNIKDVIKVDNRTVKFVFNEVFWKTLESIGIFDVLPEHIYKYSNPDEFNKRISNPVGSGPYLLKNGMSGSRLCFVK